MSERCALSPARLRLVGALFLQAREIGRRDVAGDVLAGEAGRVERLDLRIVVQAGAHQVVEVLVDQPVGADQLRDLFFGATAATSSDAAGMSMP